ncbi:hypothetical protein NliqN6_1634 [Naganishia liquefaciens]|uniref:DUF938 domain-containing protein n=1 Tax=Naganishia liquefaciens TaxID=104408 RepID=A0A8H3TQ89_9TREE|nr:hypothetical protein NliqN6_1634 [Naganishia liquefaciens]
MDYPAINSVSGSASRNRDAILQALQNYFEAYENGHILEISSGGGEHVVAMARRWPNIDFWPSERNEEQLRFLSNGIAQSKGESALENLRTPVQLDVTSQSDWTSLQEQFQTRTVSRVTGVVICNLLHCSPSRTQEDIFSHLGEDGTKQSTELVEEGGWIAIYGAFLKDDGNFASEGDEKFDQRFKGLHSAFGLRRIPDVEHVAGKYGFALEKRIPMPAGNWMLVFRRRAVKGNEV